MAWNEPGPGRDPWNQGPKRGPGGPPDIDEMLKRLKARFSGKAAPGAPLPRGLAGAVAAAIVALWAASGFYMVDEQERAVVTHFGKYVETTGPGLRWHLPWPIGSEQAVNVNGIRSVKDEAMMLTRDQDIVDIDLSVQYRVSSAQDYLFNVDDPDLTLRQATRAAVREIVGRTGIDSILAGGEQVADQARALVQQRLDQYQSGLVVTAVSLEQTQPPEPVQAAFADAIKAGEDQQRLKNEAQAYAGDRLPKARGEAARQLAEAGAYRDQVIARAEGDAARFTQIDAEYRKSPKVTRERLYLDSMNDVLSKSSKVLVDVDKSGSMIYLPLDQIIKSQPPLPESSEAVPAAAAAAAPAPKAATPPPAAPVNPYDNSRSRDRGR